MPHLFPRLCLLILIFFLACGCSSYQPVKNVWKSTKGLWNTYVSPPASIDYEEKGELPPGAKALTKSMVGIDLQLARLERVMQNADKPPTQQWLDQLFVSFPWLSGFAGIKNDGAILGQQPAESMKELDFIPLLYEDKKQNSRALRADVQPSPLGPEIMLASPLYDGVDFLGIVVAYFDMRSLMSYSENPEDLVILSPTALLWPGKYDFASTPLCSVDWTKVARESSAGTCSNERGSFIYVIRYLGNLPLIFAIAEKGDFPQGDGGLEQGYAFFPQEREKLPPPPVPERKSNNMRETPDFGRDENIIEEPAVAEEQPEIADDAEARPQPGRPSRERSSDNEIQPGSRDSVLLKGGGAKRREIQERPIEGENIEVEKPRRERRPSRRELLDRQLEMIPGERDESSSRENMEPFGAEETGEVERRPVSPTLPGGRPSPFGPRGGEKEEIEPQVESPTLPGGRPSPFGPRENRAPGGESAPAETQATPEATSQSDGGSAAGSGETNDVPRLSGGRPSPFGPKN